MRGDDKMISFFCLRNRSGNIRGHQMGSYLGAKINPHNGFENDICIHVKKTPKYGRIKVYDCVDSKKLFGRYLLRHPEVVVAGISKTAVEFLSDKLKNRIIYLPQHHCNFDREQRAKREIKVAGYCGHPASFICFENEIREKLEKIGIELIVDYKFKSRQDVINFYKKIDIQIAFRMQGATDKVLKNPLKLSNAGSFGIPSVACPEANFVAEYDKHFLPAKTIDEVVDAVYQLKTDQSLYNTMANMARERAECYHISKVAEYYRKLEAL